MQGWQRKRSEKIADMVLGAHLLTYLLAVSLFLVRLPRSYSYPGLIAVLLGFFLPAAVFAFADYQLFYKWQDKRHKYRLILWNIAKLMLLFLIITYVLASSGNIIHLEGALYLVPVVLAAITFGRLGGFIFAGAASFSLFMLVRVEVQALQGAAFEGVYILTGVFLLLAWFLGGIMEVEKSISEHLAALANEDELTGLGNHRYFQERLQLHIEAAGKENGALSLVLLDIDDFKKFNDTYGHFRGDLVLSELAALLKKSIPSAAEIFRYGSDEFTVLLPGVELREAALIADSLRETVAQHRFFTEGLHLFEGLTVSAGVANFPYHAKGRIDLLEAADEALFSSKVTGRNRIRVYLGVLEKIIHSVGKDEKELVSSLSTLITLINARDRYTYGHSERVAYYIKIFASSFGLTKEYTRLLEYGAFLHDIGKLETPQEILNKKGPLSEREWAVMQEHPRLGAEILRPITFLQPVIPMILHHHENYDGTGYPSGLSGDEIPFAARLLRIVDSFDAMKTNRPYRKPLTPEEIIAEMKKGSGSLYDPYLLEVFLRLMRKDILEEEIKFSPQIFR